MLAEIYKKKLIQGAKKGMLPLNVACSNRCKFCYERYIKKSVPSIDVDYIPKYNKESFDYFYKKIIKYNKWINPCAVGVFKEGKIHYANTSDFFNLGLSLEQIEKILKTNQKHKKSFYFYTTAYNLDFTTAKYLTDKYPNSFRIWLSISTFNENIKKKIITNWASSKKIKKIIKHLIEPRLFLLHLNYKQTIKDLKIINELRCNSEVIIHELYYNKFHPAAIKSLAKKSCKDFKKLIYSLKKHRTEFNNIKSIKFMALSEAYAWKYRNYLNKIFSNYQLNKTDLVLCSKCAYKTIKYIISNKANVNYVSDSFGGSTNLTNVITTKNIIKLINKLSNKIQIKRLFVPSSIWWIKDKYDFEGNTIDLIKKSFPKLKTIAIKIPYEVTNSSLSLEECYNYYESKTKNL